LPRAICAMEVPRRLCGLECRRGPPDDHGRTSVGRPLSGSISVQIRFDGFWTRKKEMRQPEHRANIRGEIRGLLWRSGLLVPLRPFLGAERRNGAGSGMIVAQVHRPAQQLVSASRLPVGVERGRCARPPRSPPPRRQRSSADPRRRRPLLPRPERSDIRLEPPPRAQRSKGRGVLAAPCMKLVGMNVAPARDLGNNRLGRQALLHHPQLLSRRPPPSPLRTGKPPSPSSRFCPLICKSMSKPLTRKRDPIGGLHRMRTVNLRPR
jgi:hypothetical protein